MSAVGPRRERGGLCARCLPSLPAPCFGDTEPGLGDGDQRIMWVLIQPATRTDVIRWLPQVTLWQKKIKSRCPVKGVTEQEATSCSRKYLLRAPTTPSCVPPSMVPWVSFQERTPLCSLLLPFDVGGNERTPSSRVGSDWLRPRSISYLLGTRIRQRFPGLVGTRGRPLLSPWGEVWGCEVENGRSNFISLRQETAAAEQATVSTMRMKSTRPKATWWEGEKPGPGWRRLGHWVTSDLASSLSLDVSLTWTRQLLHCLTGFSVLCHQMSPNYQFFEEKMEVQGDLVPVYARNNCGPDSRPSLESICTLTVGTWLSFVPSVLLLPLLSSEPFISGGKEAERRQSHKVVWSGLPALSSAFRTWTSPGGTGQCVTPEL